jgi:hypothetical protein
MGHYTRASVGGLALVSVLGNGWGLLGIPLTPLGRAPRECRTKADCAPADFGKKVRGDCEGIGRCDARVPQQLTGLTSTDSLSGCDCEGHRYDPPLGAASRGVNLAPRGEGAGEPGV